MNSTARDFGLLVLTLLGCSSSNTDRGPVTDERAAEDKSVESVLADDLPLGAQVLESTPEDRAFVVDASGERNLVWQHKETNWEEIWRSRNLYGAVPHTEISDFNADGLSDLFWAIDYEDLIGGMVVLRDDSRTIELSPPAEACQQPAMHKTADGFRMVVQSPGAFTLVDCGAPIGKMCMDALDATWPRFYEISGTSLREIRESEGFYRSLAEKYERAAVMLDSLLAAGLSLPDTDTPASYCGEAVPSALRELADSARAFGR